MGAESNKHRRENRNGAPGKSMRHRSERTAGAVEWLPPCNASATFKAMQTLKASLATLILAGWRISLDYEPDRRWRMWLLLSA